MICGFYAFVNAPPFSFAFSSRQWPLRPLSSPPKGCTAKATGTLQKVRRELFTNELSKTIVLFRVLVHLYNLQYIRDVGTVRAGGVLCGDGRATSTIRSNPKVLLCKGNDNGMCDR